MAKRRAGVTCGWAIAHEHGLMQANWLLGLGGDARPWMWPYGVFDTRQAARDALRRVQGSAKGYFSARPFNPLIVKVDIVTKHG